MSKRFDFKRIGGDRAAGLLALLVCPTIMSGCLVGADMAEIRSDRAYGYPSLQTSLSLDDRPTSEAGLATSATSRQRSVSSSTSGMPVAANSPEPAAAAPMNTVRALTREGVGVPGEPLRRNPVYDMERDPTVQAALRVGLRSGDIFALPVDAEGNAILPPIPRSEIIDLSEATRLLGSGETATRLE